MELVAVELVVVNLVAVELVAVELVAVELVAGGSYLAATYKIRLLFYLRYKKLGFWRYFKIALV